MTLLSSRPILSRLLCLASLASALLVCLHFGATAQAEANTSFATFVITKSGSPAEAQKQSAILNWMVRKLTDHKKTRAAGLIPLDRGMFFSRSHALGTARWLRKAKVRLKAGLAAYPTKAETALSELQRAASFYHYTHPYHMDSSQYQRVLMMLAMLFYRNKQPQQAWRFLSRGVLMNAGKIPAKKLNAAERNVVKAARCKLGTFNPSTLVVKTRGGARAVHLNGHLVGFGDQTITGLRAGEYYVSVREDGYRRWGRKRIRISPGATKTLYARNMRSSQFAYHQDLCKTMLPMKESEQLTDKMKDFSRIVRVKRLWVGCFQPDATGKAGNLKWFYLKNLTTPAKTGTLPILGAYQTKFLLLAKLTRALGFANPASLPRGLMTYKRIPKSSSCPDMKKLLKGFIKPSVRYVVLYTKYGFRLQGKLLSKTASEYTLEVTTKSSPSVLKRVVIPVNMVRYKWEPGAQQYQGFRLGERIIVKTIYGLSTTGRLVTIDDTQVQIKTKLGTESIPRSMIKSVHKRDR